MEQFKETLKIKHIKTTYFHPQSNGNIERMHSTLGNLIRTSIAENNQQWDKNLKCINFIIYTTKNQTTGFSPYELTFGSEPNIPSSIQQNPRLTYHDLNQKWKKLHELNSQKAKERIEIYKIGDLVKMRNYSKTNKPDASLKGPYKIIEILDNNQKIITKKQVIRVHIDNKMPYFVDEGKNPNPNSGSSGLRYRLS